MIAGKRQIGIERQRSENGKIGKCNRKCSCKRFTIANVAVGVGGNENDAAFGVQRKRFQLVTIPENVVADGFNRIGNADGFEFCAIGKRAIANATEGFRKLDLFKNCVFRKHSFSDFRDNIAVDRFGNGQISCRTVIFSQNQFAASVENAGIIRIGQ